MTPNPFVLAAALLALSGPATAEVYLARCKMGECIHYEQSGRRVEAQGSAAVPGELVRVRLREAVSGSPETRTANLQWGWIVRARLSRPGRCGRWRGTRRGLPGCRSGPRGPAPRAQAC